MEWVRWLDDPSAATDGRVGSKAQRLARLGQAGLRVPPGFVVLTSALDTVLKTSTLAAQIDETVAQTDVDSISACQRASLTIDRLIRSAPMFDEMRREVLDAHRALAASHDTLLAVRSSGTAEDLADASAAGQYSTVLGVTGAADLLDAIRVCWASLWSERALRYRMWKGLPRENAAMAVLVQLLIDVQQAGVLFTVDPTDPTGGTMVVEAVIGIGESLVSGTATPTRYVIPRSSPRAWRVARQENAVVPEEQLIELAAAGLLAESLFAAPQDIEWGLDRSGLTLFQTRPIAALIRPKEPATPPDEPSLSTWTRMFVGEWFRRPLTPAFASIQLPGLMDSALGVLDIHVGVRPRTPAWRLISGYLFFRFELRTVAAAIPRAAIRLPRGFRVLDRVWHQQIVPAHVARLESLARADTHPLDSHELLARVESIAAANAAYFGWHIVTGLYAMLAEWMLRALWRIVAPRRQPLAYVTLLKGLTGSSQQADAGLRALVERARGDLSIERAIAEETVEAMFEQLDRSSTGRRFATSVREWLKTYGHRQNDLDWLEPSAVEDPLPVIASLRTLLAAPPAGQRESGTEGTDDATALESVPPFARSIVALARRYYALREDRVFHLHKGWPMMRAALLELGAHFARRGVIAFPNDILFMTRDEIVKAAKSHTSEQHGVIRQRRADWIAARAWQPLALVPRPWWMRIAARSRRSSETLTGIAASPGRATGVARSVRGFDDFGRLAAGDVLIAPATTPAWSVLLSLAAGVVTERGGGFSHAALVAREYGIPAVVGVANALDKLTDGMKVTVDGDHGTVIVEA